MYTFNGILKRIKDRFKNPTSKIEGTFAMDNAQAVAQELAMIHNTQIEPVIDAVFLDTATGEDLDRRAADFFEVRHPAQAATGKLLFKGADKTYIPIGTMARLDALLFATTEAVRIDASGTALAAAICQTPGTVGNVPADVIKIMAKRLEGVQEVTNPEPFEGGTEREDDEDFRARIYDKIRFPVTSGNEYYYEYLAKQVPGIGKAKCQGTWAGPGTVKLTLLSAEGGTPDATLIDNVRQHVEAQRLIGADITYLGAVPLPVQISGKLALATGYIIEDIVQGVRTELNTYFEQIAFDRVTEYVSYHKVIEMIFRVPGVADIVELRLNGGTGTIPIGHDEFCVLQGVSLSAD